MHAPELHTLPGAQSATVAQVVAHPELVHAYGKQLMDCPVAHVPAPSHALPVSNVPLHATVPHGVPAGVAVAHAPLPLHVPLGPHVPASDTGQLPRGGEVFEATGPHVPSDNVTVSDCVQPRHSPLHAVLQHTPSTQLSVVHSRQPDTLQSDVTLHVWLCVCCGWQALSGAQKYPGRQSTSLVHPGSGHTTLLPLHAR